MSKSLSQNIKVQLQNTKMQQQNTAATTFSITVLIPQTFATPD